MTDPIKLLSYLNEIIDTIKETGSVTLDRDKDKAMLEELSDLLRNKVNTKSAKLIRALQNDYSLQSCIDYIRDKRTRLTESSSFLSNSVEYQEAVREIKLLGAVDENLVAMSIMADRMAEQLLKMPTNKLEEAAQHG